MKDIAIVQDMICVNSDDSWTTTTTDNRANYDVGYMIDDSFRNMHENFVVFGYFNKAGIWIHSREKTGYLGDPDYNSFTNGSVSGNIGVAITASNSNDSEASGVSGTRFSNFQIFSKDHHSRKANDNDDWGKACIYIDGYTSAANANINGHYFSQCGIRTYGNNPIILNQASNVSFSQCIFETPTYGTTNSNTTQFLASENTYDVIFLSCRFSNSAGLLNSQFGGKISKLIITGEPFDDIVVVEKGIGTRIGSESNKPFIQFSNNLNSKVSGIKIQSDLSKISFLKDNIEIKSFYENGEVGIYGLKNGGTKTISNGTITIGSYSYYNIDNDGTNNMLKTINGASFQGQRLVLKTATNARPFTLVRQTGNIRMKSDILVDSIFDRLELEWDGTNWVLVNFTENS